MVIFVSTCWTTLFLFLYLQQSYILLNIQSRIKIIFTCFEEEWAYITRNKIIWPMTPCPSWVKLLSDCQAKYLQSDWSRKVWYWSYCFDGILRSVHKPNFKLYIAFNTNLLSLSDFNTTVQCKSLWTSLFYVISMATMGNKMAYFHKQITV